jgi:hypothetical protein
VARCKSRESRVARVGWYFLIAADGVLWPGTAAFGPRFRRAAASRDRPGFVRLSGKGLTGWLVAARWSGGGGPGDRFHPVAGAVQWLWSLRRLWEAVISRHSDRTAALPLRWNRSIRRLALIWPNTGSMLCLRFL